MNTWAADERATDIRITEDDLVVQLEDGRTLSVPLVWFPRLLVATEEQREDWILMGGGHAIHWPQIDEDLSVQGLLLGVADPAVSLAAMRDRERQAIAEAMSTGAAGATWAGIFEKDTGIDLAKVTVSAKGEHIVIFDSAKEGVIQAMPQMFGGAAQAAQAAQEVEDADEGVAWDVIEREGRGTSATVAAERKAEELGVDLSEVEGSGAEGRITVKDVTRVRQQGQDRPRIHVFRPSRHERSMIEEAIASLSPEQREIVTLRFYKGLAVEKISERLGIPPDDVRTETRAALSTLKAQLREETPAEDASSLEEALALL